MNIPMNIPWYVHCVIYMKKKYIRKVVKNGRESYYINIPKELVKELKIKERQKLVITKIGNSLKIMDWPVPKI